MLPLGLFESVVCKLNQWLPPCAIALNDVGTLASPPLFACISVSALFISTLSVALSFGGPDFALQAPQAQVHQGCPALLLGPRAFLLSVPRDVQIYGFIEKLERVIPGPFVCAVVVGNIL